MLILCTGLGSPPFPKMVRFEADKHMSGTDIALEADTTVWPVLASGPVDTLHYRLHRKDPESSQQAVTLLAPFQAEECPTCPRAAEEPLARLPVIHYLCHQEAFPHVSNSSLLQFESLTFQRKL